MFVVVSVVDIAVTVLTITTTSVINNIINSSGSIITIIIAIVVIIIMHPPKPCRVLPARHEVLARGQTSTHPATCPSTRRKQE